jgi:hypothetical protein
MTSDYERQMPDYKSYIDRFEPGPEAQAGA